MKNLQISRVSWMFCEPDVSTNLKVISWMFCEPNVSTNLNVISWMFCERNVSTNLNVISFHLLSLKFNPHTYQYGRYPLCLRPRASLATVFESHSNPPPHTQSFLLLI